MADMSASSSPSLLRRLLIGFAAVVVILVLLLLGAVTYLNWRGERDWGAFRAEWEAKGEKFDVQDFVPAPVPDAQNFAATPLLAATTDFTKPPGQPMRWNNTPLKERASAIGAIVQGPAGRNAGKVPAAGSWQTGTSVDLIQWCRFIDTNSTNVASSPQEAARGVLKTLAAFDAELDELAAASERPHSVFRLDYSENVRMLLPHLAVLKGIDQTVRLRAVANLAAGQKQQAVDDVKLGLRLAEALKKEPLLSSQLVRIAMLQLSIQPIWEGVVRHQWSEGELRQIQSALSQVAVLEDYGPALRGERALGNAAIDELRMGKIPLSNLGDVAGGESEAASFLGGFIPPGFFRLNQLTLNRVFQERFLPVVDAEKRLVDVKAANGVDEAPELRGTGLFNIFARLLLPAIGKSSSKFAHAQVSIDLAVTACALERYRLKHQAYPVKLDPLVPEFMERVPTDVITGEILKYRSEADGSFVLYSVGWNLTDDAGEPGMLRSGKSFDAQQGDWSWRFPVAE